MDRRSFLRGSILSLAGTTAMVKLATHEETMMLSAEAPVAIGNLEPQHYPGLEFPRSPEVYVRSRHNGIFICIGIMTQLNISQGVENAMTWDGRVMLMPGMKRGELLFEGRG